MNASEKEIQAALRRGRRVDFSQIQWPALYINAERMNSGILQYEVKFQVYKKLYWCDEIDVGAALISVWKTKIPSALHPSMKQYVDYEAIVFS